MNTAKPSPAIDPNQLLRRFMIWWRRHMRDLDREGTQRQVLEDGGLSYSYVFLVISSCGIATLGLMLNSAAVIIGAMLVAPLMGPIVLLGFAIAETDVEKIVRSAKALLVGVLSALAISVVIVKLSPYIPPTPEILARTNPNLFDLLVAVLSGMVAGYAVTHRKIGTVAGVAIATALMPPLAASGYGLAMAETHIFQGAFFLFLTNMLAIALSVAGMAIWYGFGNLRTPKHLLWQTALAGIILLVLSIPLLKTLNESVTKTLVVNAVESLLRQDLKAQGARLDRLNVRLDAGKPAQVGAVIFTPKFDPSAHERLLPQLREQIGGPVEFSLDQVVLADPSLHAQAASSVIANPIGVAQPGVGPTSDSLMLARHLREILPLPITLADIDTNAKRAKLQIAPGFVGSLDTLRQMESSLRQRFPEWRISLIPPMRPLPEIRFLTGTTEPTAGTEQALQTSLWALRRWQVGHVRVTGGASLQENGRKTSALASERAAWLAEQLHTAGLEVEAQTDYPGQDQQSMEQEQGAAAWRSARIQPLLEGILETAAPTLTEQPAP